MYIKGSIKNFFEEVSIMFDKFQISEKRELLNEVLKELDKGVVFKERFQDLVLGSEVIRFPITVNGKYAGRDLIFVFDFMKSPEEMKTTELKVSYCSPYYKLVRNEEITKAIEGELSDASIEYTKREKKESITDLSVLYELEGNKAILMRNSYMPSRAIQVALSYKRSIYIPVVRIRVIHTDKEIRKYSLRLKEKLEKFTIITDLMSDLERRKWDELPNDLIVSISEVSYVKYITKKGFTEEKKILLGQDLIEEAKKENWSALDLIEKFLFRCYETKRYTLKRKADNIVLSYFEDILEQVSV